MIVCQLCGGEWNGAGVCPWCKLRSQQAAYQDMLAGSYATIADLRERVRVLEAALEWYADESNYDDDHAPGTPEPNVPREYAGWDADCGERARAALKGSP